MQRSKTLGLARPCFQGLEIAAAALMNFRARSLETIRSACSELLSYRAAAPQAVVVFKFCGPAVDPVHYQLLSNVPRQYVDSIKSHSTDQAA